MRTTSIAVLLGLCVVSIAAAQDEKKRNRFLELNPGYKEGAGGFYERSYLASASESLAKAVGVEWFTAEGASGVLKQFIYDWLDGYIEGEGEMSRAAHARVVERADAQMKRLLDDEAAFKRWVEWRENDNREENALAFITSAKLALAGLTLILPDEFAKDGWRLQSIEDDEEAAQHKACFSSVPHQLVLIEKGRKTSLALLIYRAGRVAELASELEAAKDSDVRVFWRTQQFLIFSADRGTVPETLKEHLRRQLLKN